MLLDTAEQLDLLERRLNGLRKKHINGEIELDEFNRERGNVEAAIVQLNDLQLPGHGSPGDVALGMGPKAGWWENGVLAVRLGWPFWLAPAGLLVYLNLSKAKDFFHPPVWAPSPLDIAGLVLDEVGFWVGASFALGALWPYLVGRRGLLKGLVVAAVYAVAVGTSELVGSLLGQIRPPLYIRASLLAVFLALVGIRMDRATISFRTRGWNRLLDLYRLGSIGNVGNAFVYGLTLAATAFGLWQQIQNALHKPVDQEALRNALDVLLTSGQKGR
jgi:hypothetical protein